MKKMRSFDIANDNDAKLEVLLSIYARIHSTTQEFRGSVERLIIYGCGLILLLDGWLVTTNNPVTERARIVITVGIVGVLGIFILIIRSLQQRHDDAAQVIRKINQAQMTYKQGAFLENETLFPEHWKSFGTPKWKEPIFLIAYISLPIVSVFGVIAVWFIK